MTDVAFMPLMFGGALTHLILFHLSLKKSLCLVSGEKVANSRVLLSLVVLYLEAVALVMLSTPLSFISPSFLASSIALSATVFFTSYTLKAMFGLSFRSGILAFVLWQALSLALGGLLVVTIIAAMLETIFAFILIIAFALAAWWMWSGQRGLKVGRDHLHLAIPDKRIVTIAMVALLLSSLVVPSALCLPEVHEVDVDFTWESNGVTHMVGANITWNATTANATAQGAQGQEQVNKAFEAVTGIGQGITDIVGGIVNVPGALYGLHDFKAATTYLSLINDVTQIQGILEPPPQILPRNTDFEPPYLDDEKQQTSTFARDEALASELADMSKKEFKVEVASNPDVISKAVDIEKYVDGVAWDSAFANYFTLNLPMAYETYQKVKADTGSEGEALWQAARIFGLTSPYLEFKEAWDSGDTSRIWSSGTKLGFTLVSTFFMLRSAYRIARGEGLLTAVTKTAYDLAMPGQTLYNLLKAGALKAKGAIAAIRDVGLRKALTTAMDKLANKFSSMDDQSKLESIPYDYVTNDGELDGKVIVIPTIKEAYLKFLTYLKVKVRGEWIPALKDQRLAGKLVDRDWITSFVDEIGDFQRLDELGEGTADIGGARVEIESKHWGRDCYEVTMWDTGVSFRVYEDNSISARYQGEFTRIDKEALTVKKVDLGTYLMRSYLEKNGFFDGLKPEQEVDFFGAKGTIIENGEKRSTGPYVAIKFEVTEDGVVNTKRVQFSSRGLTVNDRSVTGIEINGDAVSLIYQAGEKTPKTLISQPKTIPGIPTKLPEDMSLKTKLDFSMIYKDDTLYEDYKIVTQKLGTKIFANPKEFGKFLANTVKADNSKTFKATYGLDTYNALIEIGNELFKPIVDKICAKLGLTDYMIELDGGIESDIRGPDAVVLMKDEQGEYKIQLFKVEFECTSKEVVGGFASQRNKMSEKFDKGIGDVGIILCDDEFHIYVNRLANYGPLRNLEYVDYHKISTFYGLSIATVTGLLTGKILSADGKAIGVTDDKGNLFNVFKDSNFYMTIPQLSSVFNSNLALTSVQGSNLENVHSAGSTIVGSIITDSNVSAKLLNSIVQNTTAVCSNIVNSDINSCRILNSTLVSIVDLTESHIEDSSIAYSANIINCSVMGSNLMSVVNLVNTSISGSNLTIVANVDNTKINHSDISYSANISRSEIVNTMLRGCTVQGSRLTSCTATDSILRNINATNTNLSGTRAEFSNLVHVNATNSKLTKASVEYSNLQNVELKRAEVIGTDLVNRKVVDQTIVYGRVIDSNGNIIDPWRRVGIPNYSGQSASKTTSNASSGKGGSTISSTTTSSSSGQTKTSNANSQASTIRQKVGQQGSNAQQTSNTPIQTSYTKVTNNQATVNPQIPPMMRQKLGGQAKADTGSSSQTPSNTQTETPQQTTPKTTSPQTTTTSQQTVEKPIMRGVRTWIS